MKADSTVRARVPADGQALLDQCPAAATGLRGVRRIDGDDPATGACCLVRQDGEEGAPPRVTNGLCQMMILHHIGRLEVLVIDRVVLTNERQRCLVVKVRSLASHLSDAPWRAALPLCDGDCCPSCGARLCAGPFSAPARLGDTSQAMKMRVPSESVANASMPRSMPVSCPVSARAGSAHLHRRSRRTSRPLPG